VIHGLDAGDFRAHASAALSRPAQRAALRRATETIGERRAQAVAGTPHWEALRERARAIKDDVLARLDEYLAQFAERAEASGAQVHWARDAAEACAIVERIARGCGPGAIVKAKSMLSEEIGLNHALEAQGWHPLETDLGERIVQLARQTPSHIIVPAIHLSRGEIAELFVRELDVRRTDEPAELTAIARRLLREQFARASLGISGVNFGVAESGSLLLVENEGNIRLTTSLPPVHVALMGIEKLVPRRCDLDVFLRLLPRSGTGQHLTSYQSLLTGPARDGEEGPRELHIVLVDNGRSALLADEHDRQTLACIRCGACLNACPVYRQVGGHAYGSVYPGPIGAILTPQLAGVEAAGELPFASSLCGACRDVCPVKIDIPRILLRLRAKSHAGAPSSAPVRREALAFKLWAWTMERAWRYRCAARIARAASPLVLGRGSLACWLRARLGPLGRWTEERELRRPQRSFRALWRAELGRGSGGKRG
jgi:L-lactate dehydrogenase complex protein LldF